MDQQLNSHSLVSGSDQEWKFRLLKADILLNKRMAPEAEVVLNHTPEPQNALIRTRRLMHLGLARLRQFDIPSATKYLDQALTDAKALKSSELETLIEIRKSALQITLNQTDEAEVTLRHAIATAVTLGDDYLLAQCLGNMGIVLLRNNHLDEAIYWLQQALTKFEQLQLAGNRVKALGNLGVCYQSLGDFEKAKDLLQQATLGAEKLGNIAEQQYWQGHLGIVREEVGDYKGAITNFKKALELTTESDRKAQWLNNIALAYIDLKDYGTAELFNNQAKGLGNPDRIRYHRFNAARIAQGRKQFGQAETFYREAMSMAGKDSELILETAFRLATLFIDSSEPSKASTAFKQAEELAERQRTTMQGDEYRIFYFAKLKPLFQKYIDFLIAQGKKEEALTVADSSRARALGDSLTTASVVPNAMNIARSTQRTILYYSLGASASHLWVIEPSGMEVYSLPPEEQIRKLVEEYREFVVTAMREPDDNSSGARAKLFQLLLEPARKQLKEQVPLLVVADSFLHSINFELLPSFGDHRYLIEDHEVAVSPSLRTMQMSKQQLRKAQRSLLVVGAPDHYPEGFKDLANAAAEIQSVASFFPKDRVTKLTGEEASRTRYLEEPVENFSHLHFAMHAIANSASPLDSALILREDPRGYRVTARDLARRPLHADLVTLSACSSAGAKTFPGEGLVGLSRAFLQAGAKQVIAGLWDVHDGAAAELFADFYAGLEGNTASQSLRAAKCKMIQSKVYHKPYYWGPWQLYINTVQ